MTWGTTVSIPSSNSYFIHEASPIVHCWLQYTSDVFEREPFKLIALVVSLARNKDWFAIGISYSKHRHLGTKAKNEFPPVTQQTTSFIV